MGFYGNITNVSKTQFQFDKIYANRKEMEQNALRDGIYLGRHILIEYDQDVNLNDMLRVYIIDGGFYSQDFKSEVTRLKVGEIDKNAIVYTCASGDGVDLRDFKNYAFYICTNGRDESIQDQDVTAYAEFKAVASSDSLYVINFNIDKAVYGDGRGYDSTVWQKVFTQETEKYVMIAELNTIVPSFDVVADAPTMTPLTPHFDAQSTDVYYKLHWQTPWGFRIAKATGASDNSTYWVKEVYDPDTNKSALYYYFPNEDKWRELTTGETIPYFNGAIYFNEAGFNERQPSEVKDNSNYIKILPTGKSGTEYNVHDGSLDKQEQVDTQEVSINLPTIGNMMSKAWDIIHGPNRDDARTDENGSLQGRLDSFDAFCINQIPVKRNDDGTIVGSTINGAKQYDAQTDLLTLQTGDGSVEEFDGDDAWISTYISTDHLEGGLNEKGEEIDQSNNCGIAIHHTFHPTQDSISTLDKNDGSSSTTDKTFKEKYIPVTNILSHSTDDILILYTPYVDAKGHVVGKNLEEVTLPYGFKSVYTNGRDSYEEDMEVKAGTLTARNTKDQLVISSGNKWIHTRLGDSDSELILDIAHEVNEIDISDAADLDMNNTDDIEEQNAIYIPVWSYDNAGHIEEKHNKKYILPYGYKTFKDSEESAGVSTANNTQDTFVFKGDNWLKPIVTDDLVTFSHTGPVSVEYEAEDDVSPNFGDEFTIVDWYYDEMGHMSAHGSHTVTIPQGSLEDANFNNADVITQLAFDKPSGKITSSRTNVGDLLLTGYNYSSSTDNSDIAATDSIKEALRKLQLQMHDEESNRIAAINSEAQERLAADNALNATIGAESKRAQAEEAELEALIANETLNRRSADAQTLADAKAYADAVKKAILTGESSTALEETYDTLVEIQEWIKGDGVNTTELTTAIAQEADRATKKEAELEGTITTEAQIRKAAIDALGNAAYTSSTDYATADQGAKADTALQRDTLFSTTGEAPQEGDNAATISEMFAMIIELQDQVAQLQQEVAILKQHHENPDEGTVE